MDCCLGRGGATGRVLVQGAQVRLHYLNEGLTGLRSEPRVGRASHNTDASRFSELPLSVPSCRKLNVSRNSFLRPARATMKLKPAMVAAVKKFSK